MREMRYAVRLLMRDPSFTLVALAALALGIGVNTAIFSVVNAALVRPLPYPDSGRLAVIWDRLAKLGLERFPVSYANYLDYKTAGRAFERLAAFREEEFNLTAAAQAERIPGIRVSAELLPLLGVKPAAGRIFADEENQPGRDNVALLSDALWRRRFGRDPGVLGKTVTLDGNAVKIVGILPYGFSFSAGGAVPEIWMPLALPADPSRTTGALELMGRLKPSITIEQARADMQSVARGVEERYHPYRGPRGEDAGYDVRLTSLRDELYGGMRRGLLVLLAAVACVLLIACANVASLLLARTTVRRREMAVRQALGAGRIAIIRQLLLESLTLALIGGAFGLVLAFWTVQISSPLLKASLPNLDKISIDARVLGFTLLVSLVTGVIFGILPALQGSGLNLSETLKEAGRGSVGHMRSGRLRHALIAAEVALSVVLVVGAGLLIQSFHRLIRVNPGFRVENLVTARISLPESQYGDDRRVAAFFQELLDRVRSVPGIQSASMVSRLPLTGGPGGDPFSIEGRPYDAHGLTPQVANQQVVSGAYFRTMQIPLIQGRLFLDHEPQPVTIINAAMARGFWPGSQGQSDAIGRRILLGAPRPDARWLTIVGVVEDVRNAGLKAAPLPQMYVPIDQTPVRAVALVLRTTRDPGSVISAVRGQLFSLDPDQPLYDVKTMEQRVAADTAQPRFQAFLLSAFAALALVLAAVGVYGVIARSVVERTHEIGVRMALGARPAAVRIWILRQGAVLGLLGIALGFAGSAMLARLMAGLLYEVPPLDAPTFAGASFLLMGVVLAACYIPARRAARLDPMAALRHQ
ncbi:MAG TPA: ABC transporter permease [Bryobacteraceae bacterium]|nr:ABC transporter permease [Bryobacteraceae bacterium]